MAEIENLSISIGAHADEAFVAFDRLISKLNRTKIELKAFSAGAVVSALKEIKDNASAAASALNRFANAQERANRAMGGFTGAGYTYTMRGAASDVNRATNAITRFVNAMATAQSAMQRMRYANPYGSNRPYAPTQPRLTGEVQEPIETTFVDDNSGDLNGIDHEEPRVQRFNKSMQSLRDTLRSILQPLGDVGKQLGSVFAAGARRAAHSLAGFFRGLLRIAKFRIFRTIVKDLGQSFKDLYGWSNAFGTDFAGSMDKITTAFTYLRNSIAAMVAPLVNAVAPALDFIVDKVVDVLNWFNQLFAAIGGQDTYTVAKKIAVSFGDTLTSTSGKAKKAADEIKRTILGFDEINKLVSPKDNSTSSGSGSSPYSNNYKMMFEEKPLSGGFKGFSDAIEKSLNDTLSRIGLIISGASLAVGAILTFSGANVPLGLSLMAAGASGLVSIIGMNWNGLSADVKLAIGAVEAVVGGSLLAIGGVLAFSGVNPALGIAMMAAGAISLAAAIGLNWDLITGKVSASAKGVVGAISAASLALGAILTFTGANVPLGVGLLVAGATGAAATISWDWLSENLRGKVATITSIVSGSLLAIGALLAFSNASLPLGIGMMAAGAVGLAATATANWDVITETLRGPIGTATALISGAALVLGAVAIAAGRIPLGVGLLVAGSSGLASTIAARWDRLKSYLEGPIGTISALIGGASLMLGFVAISAGRIPLGVGLLVAGASGLTATIAARWDRLKGYMQEPIGTITTILSGASLMLGFVAIAAGRIPLGLGLIVAGATGIAASLTANWDILQQKLQGPIGTITGILSGATLLLGIIALVGGNIPLGLGLILSGAAGLVTTIAANWDNLKQLGVDAINKVKEGWESVKNAFKINILPTMDNPVIAHFLGMNTPEEIARQEEEDAGAMKFAQEYARQNNTSINVDFVANGNKSYKNSTLGNYLVDTMKNVKATAQTKVSSIAGTAMRALGNALQPIIGNTDSTNTVKALAGPAMRLVGTGLAALVGDTTAKNTVNGLAGIAMKAISGGLSAVVGDTSSKNTVNGAAGSGIRASGNAFSVIVGDTNTTNTVNGAVGTGMVYTWEGYMPKTKDTATTNTVKAAPGAGVEYTWDGFMPVMKDTTSTVNVNVQTPWGTSSVGSVLSNVANSVLSSLGLSNLSTDVDVGLKQDGWTSVGGWITDNRYNETTVYQKVGLEKNGWDWVDNWAKQYAQTPISQKVNLVLGNVDGKITGYFGGKRAKGGVFSGGKWSDIPQYAGGTAGVNHGSLFWAGENGTEIVGNAGGRTEVLNKSQIASAMFSAVQAAMAPAAANFAEAAANMGVTETGFDLETLAEMIRQGVEQAMSRSNDYDRQKVELLRSINDKDFNVDVSTASINKAQSRMNRRAGVTIAPVGT